MKIRGPGPACTLLSMGIATWLAGHASAQPPAPGFDREPRAFDSMYSITTDHRPRWMRHAPPRAGTLPRPDGGFVGPDAPTTGRSDVRNQSGPGGFPPPAEFLYFDGFETYGVDANPNDDQLDPDFAWATEVNPDGFSPAWDFNEIYSPVATLGGEEDLSDGDDPSAPNRQILQSGADAGAFLPPSRNPFNPGGVGGYPEDRDPAVEQSLSTQRGTLRGVLGEDVDFFGSAGTTLFDLVLPGDDATPTGGDALIILLDVYFPDLETMFGFDIASSAEDMVITRVLLGGYNPLPDWQGFLDGQGRADHYGALSNVSPFPIPEFLFIPEGGIGESALDAGDGVDTLTIRTNEWITIAIRTSHTDTQVWVRDARTDGAVSTISDPTKVRFFETGWAQILPGRAGLQIAPGVYEGVGVAENRAGFLVQPTQFGRSADDVTIFTGLDPVDPNPVVEGWAPTNTYFDNFTIIGERFLDCPSIGGARDVIDAEDLSVLLSNWGEPTNGFADLAGRDGVVNAADLAVLLATWGLCP